MKQILTTLFIAILLAGAFSFSSCHKCTTCAYTYQIAGQPVSTYTYPELCGNNEEINDYKQICENKAAVYGNTCNCIYN